MRCWFWIYRVKLNLVLVFEEKFVFIGDRDIDIDNYGIDVKG